MAVHAKLNKARLAFHNLELRKSGRNAFAGYSYFELGDFVVPALQVFDDFGLCAVITFNSEYAQMTITDVEDNSYVVITSPMGSAALKGCHEVQNIGAVESYQRRYLWMCALEIVEHDALDATTGKAEPAAKNMTDEQLDEIQTLIDETNTDIQRVCKQYKVTGLKLMNSKDYQHCKATLLKKKQRMEAKADD